MNPLDEYPKHFKILNDLFFRLPHHCSNIFDAGSGRTSLYYLCKNYPESQIDALVFPGDKRKLNGIKEDVLFDNYNVIEADIMNFIPELEYDIVLSHLLLGESGKFGRYASIEILKQLLSFPSKYYVVIDIADDPVTNWPAIISLIKSENKILSEKRVGKYVGVTF